MTPTTCGTARLGSYLLVLMLLPATAAASPQAEQMERADGPVQFATSICRGMGWIGRLVFEPLTLGRYDAETWFQEPRQCYTLLGNTLMALGSVGIESIGHPRQPPVFGAGSFDLFFRTALRSPSDTELFGSEQVSGLIVPVVASGAVLVAGAAFGRRAGYDDALTRALPLLGTGIGGTMLFTNTFKKSFGRERPFFKFADPARRATLSGDDVRESFYSGHAGTAFFAAAFADPVLADIIRTAHPDYALDGDAPWRMRLLRFGQALALYGLASAVGVSRIVDDQHFMTDVLTGALAGTVHGQLTYRWGYRSPDTHAVQVSGFPGAPGLMLEWRL